MTSVLVRVLTNQQLHVKMIFRISIVFLVHSTFVKSQYNLGTLGSGLLYSTQLQTGGLVYPNPDGSGPQADSLAAAIYGVAVPPGFSQFSSSDIYFGGNQGDSFSGGAFKVQASDLLVGTGIHSIGKEGGQGDSLAGFSPFISDFSPFGGAKPHNENSADLNTAPSSSLVQIDPIAARFGAVIPNDNHGSIFHPSLSGTSETSLGATAISIKTNTVSAGNEFISPIETSIRFDIPNQVNIPENTQPATEGDFSPSNGLVSSPGGPELSRSDGSSSDAVSDKPVEMITNAFKFSDDQISKTEAMQRNFEQASGKFTTTIVPADFELPKTTDNPDGGLLSTKTKDRFSLAQRQRSKEVTIITKGQSVSKTPSPYTYRGNQRDRHFGQQSKTSAVIVEPPPTPPPTEAIEDLPNPQALLSYHQANKETAIEKPIRSATYTFMMAPGYRKTASNL